MRASGFWRGLTAALLVVTVLSGCERGPMDSSQTGWRGTGMVQLVNRRQAEADAPNHTPPEVLKPARIREGAPTAGTTYKNVQVLGELTIGEFGRTMNAITAWIAPQQSCAYCHVEGNLASDDKYTKRVARRMLQMVRQVNTAWQPHIGNTGITCYTCHRGQPLPAQVWFRPGPDANPNNLLLNRSRQNAPTAISGLSSLPNDAVEEFLGAATPASPLRVVATGALRQPIEASGVQTERTYSLMMHISKSLGVNCSFCHNSRSFASWTESTPQRTTAWHGLRMVREINTVYLEPLAQVFPRATPDRLGPSGDAAKLHCATCHQGINKPLYGAQTARYYPALWPAPKATAPAAPASAASAPGEGPGADPAAAAAAMAAASASQAAPQTAASSPTAAAVVAAASAPTPPVAAAAPAVADARTPPAPAPVPAVAATPPPSPALAGALPPAPPADGSPDCTLLAAAAMQRGRIPPEATVHRQVTGSGRLQFYTAPHPGCRMNGVFILTGEPGEVGREIEGWSLLWYTNPRTGGQASGWVTSTRLAPITEATATALMQEGAKGVKTTPVPATTTAGAPAQAPAAAAAPAAGSAPKAAESSAALATMGADLNCIQIAFEALQRGRALPASATSRRVVGSGPLPFYWAPDARCRMDGVAIAEGEPVEGDREVAGYTAVWFRNPRTGAEAIGWVSSARLAPGEMPAGR